MTVNSKVARDMQFRRAEASNYSIMSTNKPRMSQAMPADWQAEKCQALSTEWQAECLQTTRNSLTREVFARAICASERLIAFHDKHYPPTNFRLLHGNFLSVKHTNG